MIRYRLKQMIGEKEFAEQRHVRITEVSERTGVHRSTLSKMLNEFGYVTSTDVLNKLCSYFGCRLEQVAEYVPDEIKAKAKGKGLKSRRDG